MKLARLMHRVSCTLGVGAGASALYAALASKFKKEKFSTSDAQKVDAAGERTKGDARESGGPHHAGKDLGRWKAADRFDQIAVGFGIAGDEAAERRDDVERIEVVECVEPRHIDGGEFQAQKMAPDGEHTMSIFAQYVPYKFARGTWDERREEVRQLALNSLARFCSNIDSAVIDTQVLGPPDIERKVGLTGGHIFQGECLPPYMWSSRLSARTPMPGVYLCGACTHPGGSVIGINGRNAAMVVLRDTA